MKHPAIRVGLYLLAGIAFALEGISLAFLVFLLPKRKIGFLVFVGGFIYATLVIQPFEGEGVFKISQLQESHRFGRRGWIVQGRLNGRPVYAYLKKRPRADCHARVEGTLVGRRLKVEAWEPIEGSFSLAEKRFEWKKWLKGKFGKGREAAFLAGLLTGDFSEPTQLFDFGRLGLAHLMAISGFHFSILAMALGVVLRLILPYRWTAVVLLILLSAYFLFIGARPSIQRAWVMAVVALLGTVFERRTHAMNSLGVALIVVLVWDPYAIYSVGFQFSFLCTAAILRFYRPLERWLFSPLRLRDAVRMDLLSQHGYILLAIFRKGLALTIAAHLVAVPLTLYHFGQFQVFGLIHNLIFPFLISAGILFCSKTCIGVALNLSQRLPLTLHYVWRVEGVPLVALLILFVLLFNYEPGLPLSFRGVARSLWRVILDRSSPIVRRLLASSRPS